MYEYFEKLLEKYGVTTAEVCKACDIRPNTISNWKKRRHILNADLLKRIADYFNVSVDYLLTGKETEQESTEGNTYYFDDESAQAAQLMFTNKKLRLAFDALASLPEDDLKKYYAMLLALKETENSEDD